MLEIPFSKVMNMDLAIQGARNPLNSWDRGDSYSIFNLFVMGPNDKKLCRQLCKAGSDHRKFLRQIFVSVDIIAPLYWWKEFDTYKIGTVANSCSTMHKIHSQAFSLDDFSHDKMTESMERVLDSVIDNLELARTAYIETKDKQFWWDMIQMLPSSYNQRRTVTLNYEVLINIYYARKSHKLDEWHVFCDWIKGLPYAELLILVKGDEKDV